MDTFQGLNEKSAGKLLAEFAWDRAKEKGISFGVALTEVRREFPELSEDARQEAFNDNGGQEIIPGQFAGRPHSWERHQKITRRSAEKLIPYSQAAAQIDSEEPELAAKARSEGAMDIKDIKRLPNGFEMVICDTELGRTADPAGLFARAVENRSKAKRISYRAALSEISRDYPRLTAAARALRP